MAKRPEPKERWQDPTPKPARTTSSLSFEEFLSAVQDIKEEIKQIEEEEIRRDAKRAQNDDVGVFTFTVVIVLIAIGIFCTTHFALNTLIPWFADLNDIVQAYRSFDGLTLPRN